MDVLYMSKFIEGPAAARDFIMVRNARSSKAGRVLLLAYGIPEDNYDVFMTGQFMEIGPVFPPGAIREIFG